ncbi:tRNA (adenosine(37)-N6)-threonylcarbamoyltransferase complex ATPase subunit type 1 TsaE [Anaerospora sp.]|uniref:tRNA (adenosine(37)-N6)-threonylcarbamoyltransferase complex ATPase subunit type 1 TsaE n=1 Tax=Anaerospora sp. TaxID=1960278 RepID=UPI00289CE7C4|nr:tRNA (adenosine(37)-N6)-threonylcarbamoyltransferase complex ATPase subunit type 1 TsaE [Anaerospora sp.]
MEIVSTAPEQSFSFGRQLGQLLQEGSVICLIGNLGAGKTLLVQGIAQGLGLNEEITSPTFTVMNVYEGTIPVYHFDLYRLESPEQLVDIGFDEYTNAGGIAIIEWPDKFPGFMPDSYLRIELIKTGDNDRLIKVSHQGAHHHLLYEELKQACS